MNRIKIDADDTKTLAPKIMLLGAEFYSDDINLYKSVSDGTVEKNFPHCIDSARAAILTLERRRLRAKEIHFFNGQVRAMAGLAYGRQDSGWLDIIDHSVDSSTPCIPVGINGKIHRVSSVDILTYEKVERIAFASIGSRNFLTCTFSSCFGQGTLTAGQTGIRPKPGMKITILDTSGA